MNKGLIVTLFVALVLVFTNPKTDEHKSAVKARANDIMRAELTKPGTKPAVGLVAMLTGAFIDKLIDINITSNNYLLFSTTTFTEGQKKSIIGLGILGNVYLSSKIDDTFAGRK
jgi:hypothetical protein